LDNDANQEGAHANEGNDPVANDLDNDANQGAHANKGKDPIAHDENQGAPIPDVRPYNLRDRNQPRGRFATAMDNPHSNKSYYPPQQLTQYGIHMHRNECMEEMKRFAMEYVLTQMSAKAGLRKHGKAAEAALMSEFAQLEALDVYRASRREITDQGTKEKRLTGNQSHQREARR
jgi:hypothetical protein